MKQPPIPNPRFGPPGYDPFWDSLDPHNGVVRYFDRELEPISLRRMVELSEDDGYRVVAQTHVSPAVMVSTVWLGLDHCFPGSGSGAIVFETAVRCHLDMPVERTVTLPDGSLHHWVQENEFDDLVRWPSEAAALAGHDQVVAQVKHKVSP